MSSEMAFTQMPAVAALNKVDGFDPLQFLRDTPNGGKVLDLKFKKLWFRLHYPNGRIKMDALKITDQMAIIEAKVYLAKEDAEPVSTFVATGYAQSQGQLYITSAQYEAANNALADAGFGIQFCDIGDEAAALQKPAHGSLLQQGKAAAVKLAVAPQRETAQPEKKPEAAQPPPPPEKNTVRQTSAVQVTAPTTAPNAGNVRPKEQEAPTRPVSINTESAAPKQAPQQSTVPLNPQPVPASESTVSQADTPRMEELPDADTGYTADMPVDSIIARMTPEEAKALVVEVGSRKGMTLAAVAEKYPSSLKWYVNGYDGDDNILRAGARLMLEQLALPKAG